MTHRRCRAGALVLSLALAASGAAAQTFTAYDCTFVIRGWGGETTELLFALDGAGGAFTYDVAPGTDRTVRVPAKLRKLGGGSLLFAYSFNLRNVDGRTARMTLQVRTPEGGGASRVNISAQGYTGNPAGNGTCAMKRNVRLP
jgi:hypothetical protein